MAAIAVGSACRCAGFLPTVGTLRNPPAGNGSHTSLATSYATMRGLVNFRAGPLAVGLNTLMKVPVAYNLVMLLSCCVVMPSTAPVTPAARGLHVLVRVSN